MIFSKLQTSSGFDNGEKHLLEGWRMRNRRRRRVQTLLFLTACGFLLEDWTLDYIEPGTTSFFIKLLISSLAGVAISLRFIWRIGRQLFGRHEDEKQEREDETKNQQGENT